MNPSVSFGRQCESVLLVFGLRVIGNSQKHPCHHLCFVELQPAVWGVNLSLWATKPGTEKAAGFPAGPPQWQEVTSKASFGYTGPWGTDLLACLCCKLIYLVGLALKLTKSLLKWSHCLFVVLCRSLALFHSWSS